jgi:hypothetical protein
MIFFQFPETMCKAEHLESISNVPPQIGGAIITSFCIIVAQTIEMEPLGDRVAVSLSIPKVFWCCDETESPKP